MRLEFLAEGTGARPLIRLFDFTPNEACGLRAAVERLAAGQIERVAVHDLIGVEAVGGCELTFVRKGWDQSIMRVGPLAFECGLTPGTWDNMAGLIEPFAAGSDGYQWLAGDPGEAALLLSPSGYW